MAASVIRLCRHTIRRFFNVASPAASLFMVCPQQQSAFPNLQQVREYAARKGTRMKQQKKKAASKKEPEKKEEFVPYRVLLEKSKKSNVKKRSEMGKRLLETPIDNVYPLYYYKWPTYSIEEAINLHRESHHPTMYNAPNALVNLCLDLDLSLKKKNRYVDDFRSLIHMPHDFNLHSPRKVLVICTRPEEVQQANAAGAYMVGGIEIVKRIQTGDIPADDFDHVVSTPDIVTELLPLRGVLKKRFPNRAKGSLGFDIAQMVDFFANGVEYKTSHDENENEYGMAAIPVGKLQMPIEHLEKNIEAAVKEVCTHRDAELGPFIRVAYLTSPPTKERFNIAFKQYLPVSETAGERDEDEEVEETAEEEEKVSVSS